MNNLSDNTAEKQRGRPFEPGTSGNPNGRPRGSRNKTTLMLQSLLSDEAEVIVRQLIQLAKSGDLQAIKLVIERLIPPKKDNSISYIFDIDENLPKNPEDINILFAELIYSLNHGNITPAEARTISAILENYRKSIETSELHKKIEEIELILKLGGRSA